MSAAKLSPSFCFHCKTSFPISTEFSESVTLKLPTDQILSILNFLEVVKLFFVSGQIPEDARSNAWVSFDGKRRQQLSRGDSVRIFMSQHPLPTVNKADQTGDWFRSLIRCLNWNERLDQKALWSLREVNWGLCILLYMLQVKGITHNLT